MSTPSRYEIELRGRPTHRVLHPVVDDFRIEPTGRGTTRLEGEVRDPSHLHGLLAHFTSMNVELVALRCLDANDANDANDARRHDLHTHPPRERHHTMTIATPTTPTADTRRGTERHVLTRVGGAAALLAAGTFVYGIAVFATTLADYTDPDATPAASVDFLVGHQGSLLAWYLGIFIVFGAALVPMALALRRRLASEAPLLANTGMVFAAMWATLMYATGMISNIGIEAVADLAESDPERAATVWSAIDTVTNGLGGGNELVGGIWILLVSVAGLLTTRLPRWLNVVGIVTAVAGLVTVVPDFEAIEMIFGLGSIIWFIGIGLTLVRDGRSGEVAS